MKNMTQYILTLIVFVSCGSVKLVSTDHPVKPVIERNVMSSPVFGLAKPDTIKKDTTIKVVDTKAIAQSVKPIEAKIDQTQDILKNLSVLVSGQNMTNQQVSQVLEISKQTQAENKLLKEEVAKLTKEKQEERLARIQEQKLREQQETLNDTFANIMKNLPLFVGILLIITAMGFYYLGRIVERNNLNISI